ncbi:hypothetical protein D7D25_03635 [Proteiniphilum sp. X52]|nr:hypothetical protein D7D25_03635 [Proteiniphilum sp. X52]
MFQEMRRRECKQLMLQPQQEQEFYQVNLLAIQKYILMEISHFQVQNNFFILWDMNLSMFLSMQP